MTYDGDVIYEGDSLEELNPNTCSDQRTLAVGTKCGYFLGR